MHSNEQTITARGDHILIERPPGFEVTPEEQPEAIRELADACEQAGCSKVLVVGPRTYVDLSAFDILDLGKTIADIGIQIAVVEMHNASDDAVSLLETSATARGGPIRFFDTIDAAKNWLEIN